MSKRSILEAKSSSLYDRATGYRCLAGVLRDASRFLCIELRTRFLDGEAVVVCPRAPRRHPFAQPLSRSRERIVDARRNRRKDRARYQTVAREPPHGEGQHALRDALDVALELRESPGAVAEHRDDEHAPFVPDAVQHLARRETALVSTVDVP